MATPTTLGSLSTTRAAPRRQLIATRGTFPVALEGGTTSNTRYENHILVTTGAQDCTSLRVHYVSFRSRETEDSTLSVSPFSLQAAVVFNSQFCPVSFNGTTTTTVDAGVTLLTSNPISIYLPAFTEFMVKTGVVLASNQSFPASISATNKTVKVASTSATSQIFQRFNVSTPSGGITTSLSLFPVMITGIPRERFPALFIWGDSLSAGTGDFTSDAEGVVGCMEKACINTYGTGKHLAFCNLSRSGDASSTYELDEAFSRFSLLEFGTHVLFSMGSNDITGGRTAAQIKASMQEAWTHARILGLSVGAMTLPPRTTSADNWSSLTQHVVTGYSSASIRGEINTWLKQQLAEGAIDFLADVNSQVADTTNPDVWKVGYTADGTHYTPTVHNLLADYLRGLFATFRV